MSYQLIIGVLDGEITDVTTTWMNSEVMEIHFPIGEVYRLASEGGDVPQWRVLQRSTKTGATSGLVGTYAALLPAWPEQIPEIVRMVALMRE
jgi:hypothetical protein